MSALEAWKQRVTAHREQSHQIRSALGVTGQDRWEPFSSFFKADPRRTDDTEVNRLAQEVTPTTTLHRNVGRIRYQRPTAWTSGPHFLATCINTIASAVTVSHAAAIARESLWFEGGNDISGVLGVITAQRLELGTEPVQAQGIQGMTTLPSHVPIPPYRPWVVDAVSAVPFTKKQSKLLDTTVMIRCTCT